MQVNLSDEMIATVTAVLQAYKDKGLPRIASGNPDLYEVDNTDALQFFKECQDGAFL